MKISIITATWNSGITLRDTMISVLQQSYSNWEHIIVDGGSKDNSLAIIREMEPLYKGRLKWISEPDKGIYDAMNKGFDMATGDVIGILNADDFYTSDKVMTKVSVAMTTEDIDAVFGDIHFVDNGNLKKCVRYYSSRWFYPWMMLMGYQPAHPSFYCRKSIYDKYGNFDINFKIAADFELLLRLIYINHIRTHYLPLDFVTMRNGGASTSGLRSHKQILSDHIKAYHKHHITIGLVADYFRYPLKLAEKAITKIFH